MAQSGFTPISLYFSATSAAVPSAGNLVAGELALNTNDGKLYYKNSSGVVTLLAGATSGPAGGSTTQVQYNNAGVLAGITGATTNGTALTLTAPVLGTPASGTVTNLTGTASININGTVGATTPAAGSFTTVSSTGILAVAANAVSTIGGFSSADVPSSMNLRLNRGVTQFNGIAFAGAVTYDRGIYLRPSSDTIHIGRSAGGVFTEQLSVDVSGNVTAGGTISSTGLAVTGTISASAASAAFTGLQVGTANSVNSGLIIGNKSSGTGAIWSTSITPSATNYAFHSDGGQVAINASTSATLNVANSVIASATSTGLAVTGTLSATGNVVGGNYSTSLQTLSAWTANTRATQLTTYGAVASNNNIGNVGLSCNAYESTDSNWKRVAGTSAGLYQISYTGAHTWYSTGASSADSAISWTTQMTLDASGRLYVGAASFGFALRAAFRGDSTTVPTVEIQNESATGKMLTFRTNGESEVGSVSFTSAGVLYNVTSDQRLKENIVDAPDFGSVIDSLQVRSFDWKADQTHQRAGFIAQELATVAPEAVHQPINTDEMMAVDYSKLVPMLVKEIQSLRKRITALEAK